MGLKCLVLVGHPIEGSFNAALAERYAAVLTAGGAEVRVMHLDRMEFEGSLRTRKPGDAELIGDAAEFWDNLVWSEHFVLVHPLWWGGMPARLKALFDLTLQSGKAYRYEGGKPLPNGLLKGRSARLVVTSDTPDWFMRLAYGDAHFKQVTRQIFKFCGLGPVRRSHASVMKGSTPQARAKMLERLAKDAARDLRGR